MRYVLCCWIAVLATSSLAQAPRPADPNLAAAQQLAAQQNKLVLLHFGAPWCGPCVQMERAVLSRPDVMAALESRFVVVKVDVDQQPELAERFKVERIPADCVLTPEGEVVHTRTGPALPEDYVGQLYQVASQSGPGARPTTPLATASPAPASPPAQNDSLLGPRYAIHAAPPASVPAGPPQPSQLGPPGMPPASQPIPGMVPVQRGEAPGNAAYAPPGHGGTVADLGPRYAVPSTAGVSDPSGTHGDRGPQTAAVAPPAGMPPIAGTPGAAPQAVAGPPHRYAPAMPQGPVATAPYGPVASAPYGPMTTPPQQPQPPQPAPQQPQPPQDAGLGTGTAPATPPPLPDSYRPHAAQPAAVGPGAPPPVALEGYCPVTLVERKAWAKGDPQYGAVHRGQTYHFAGSEEQRRFLGDPDRYAPMISGYDPVLAKDYGRLTPGDRRHGVFYGSRVLLFASEETLTQFCRAPQRYLPPDAVRR